MSSGYSGTPLEKKLGLKEGLRLGLLQVPTYYRALFSSWPASMEVKPDGEEVDFIHAFYSQYDDVNRELPHLKERITPSGTIWISWPKKASGRPTDLTEDRIRDLALQCGLVDVKVCAVDETWSALKLVIRVKDRKAKAH